VSNERLPQFILSILVLSGFALMVGVYMLVDMTDKNAEVVKTIITSMGTACLLVLGYWFGPSKT
jgi:peptidoglycan/LPS O-acetylase OafA/YrhL